MLYIMYAYIVKLNKLGHSIILNQIVSLSFLSNKEQATFLNFV